MLILSRYVAKIQELAALLAFQYKISCKLEK